ncbi:MAG: 1-deoxy-D-xylulose-5-phosphate reductoisomerase [Kiritimatiellae bacterium]|nr:1-deoxy-D-xylulose-5-phosphate reductoisomerase [Kiritimatiellia bacterium]
MSKRIIILGATGSIGMNAVDVVRTHPDEFSVVAVAAHRSQEKCEALGKELGAKAYCGKDAAVRAVGENDADICLVATVGMSGLKPTLAAIEKGMDIALATKEVMVMAGEFVTRRAREKGVRFLPVDSEHSAIFQCLGTSYATNHQPPATSHQPPIIKLILTASGGPFLDEPKDLSQVTVEQALNHPRWKMGPKVTVDSSTMMNKGFEILEARWLFDVPVGRIDVVVHPESIVHSLVTFTDGATLAQMSPPDMRVAIQYALTWPDRLPSKRDVLDLAKIGALTFRAPDSVRFPCLRLVKEACARGGCAAAVLAAADEWAVQAFLDGKIKYTDIAATVADCLEHAPEIPCDSLDAVWAATDWVSKHLRA